MPGFLPFESMGDEESPEEDKEEHVLMQDKSQECVPHGSLEKKSSTRGDAHLMLSSGTLGCYSST